MNITTVIKKKIYYPYIALGFILFIILSSLNYFYSNHILAFRLANQYNVSAIQLNLYKNKAQESFFKYIFDNKIKTLHRVKDLRNTDNTIYFKKNKTEFNLTLILDDYVDDKKLENIINEEYSRILKKNLKILEENSFLFDYEYAEIEYQKHREYEIQLSYDILYNSELAKKYPPQNCDNTIEFCLVNAINYYKFIVKNLKIHDVNDSMSKFINKNNNKDYPIATIYKDFTTSKNIYENQNLENLLNEPIFKANFYKNKFKDFKNSKFLDEFSFKNDCTISNYQQAIWCTSNMYNDLIKIYKGEINNPFKIKYQVPEERKDFDFLFETIKIASFSLLVTYILFILTNKFLSRKLK
jgi:nucleoside diphosphate kinase